MSRTCGTCCYYLPTIGCSRFPPSWTTFDVVDGRGDAHKVENADYPHVTETLPGCGEHRFTREDAPQPAVYARDMTLSPAEMAEDTTVYHEAYSRCAAAVASFAEDLRRRFGL